VLPILVALQVDTMRWPPYASMMLLELYDISGEHYMRIIYNGEVLELPFCGSKALCSYAAFSSYYRLRYLGLERILRTTFRDLERQFGIARLTYAE